MKKNIDPVLLAFFTALAVTIYLLENLIPKPLPFMKLGLANAIVLMLIWKREYPAGFIVLVSKTIIGGFFSGLLISPMTIISLGAGITAYLVMFAARTVKIPFSIIGLSIAGATAHNLMQLIIVNWLLLNTQAIWKLLPLLLIMGIITGIVTGYIALLMTDSAHHEF